MKSIVLTLLLLLNSFVTAAEVNFDPIVPSSVIKKITLSLPVMRSKDQKNNREISTSAPQDINAIYSLAENNSRIKKLLNIALIEKKNEIFIESKTAVSPYAFENHTLWRILLDWAYSSLVNKSFVMGLGAFLSELQSGDNEPSFIRRNILLRDAITFSKLLGFEEISQVLAVFREMNKKIMEQLKPDRYTKEFIAERVFRQFSDQFKHIAQLDVDFARRIDPQIFDKILAQPKYANALTSELNTDDLNKMAELDLLIKAMKTMQEDAYKFYPAYIEKTSKPVTDVSQEKKIDTMEI